MKTTSLINLQQICILHNINDAFVLSLQEFGLVEIITIEERHYIHSEQLKEVEKMIRLHYDLNINIEGIDTIHGLLEKIDGLQKELTRTKNRLRLYE